MGQKNLAYLGFILFLSIFFLASYTAQAATGLTIQPVKISETLTPGQEVSGTILLTNASDQDVSVELSLQDFIPVAGAEGIQFVGRTDGATTVRDWINLPGGTSFTFKKGAVLEVPYTIEAPQNAEPGSHFGVIFFKARDIAEGQQSLKVGTQVGVLVLVTVPGNHLQKGNILSFSVPSFVAGRPVPFTLKFENTGTVHFEPKGEIVITNMLGKHVGTVAIEGQTVLPTGIKDLHFEWQGDGFLLGKYTAVATVRDGEGTALTSETITFYAAPIWYIALFVLGATLLFFIFKFVRRHVSIKLR